jgi:hypothetical protein
MLVLRIRNLIKPQTLFGGLCPPKRFWGFSYCDRCGIGSFQKIVGTRSLRLVSVYFDQDF